MKNNLIFLHIPKCGGTTFHQILKREYNLEKTFVIDVLKNSKLNTDEFINLPQDKRSAIKLLRGHMHFGLHKYMLPNTKYITFLRDPVERVISHYNYTRKLKNHRLHEFAMKRSLSEYVEDINPYINNAMVYHLSGLSLGVSHSEKFDKAIENLENYFAVIGILECYNESLIRMKQEFDWKIPYYQKLNTTSKTKNKEIDPKAKELILKYNKEDIKLYNIYKQKHLDIVKKNKNSINKDLFFLDVKNYAYSLAKKIQKNFE